MSQKKISAMKDELEALRTKKIKSNLSIFSSKEVGSFKAFIPGLTIQVLAGDDKHPSERIGVALATFEPGTHELLHWHFIETFHFVISGNAIVKNFEGKSTKVTVGDVVYAPPGMEGAHEWIVKESLQVLSVRATNEPALGTQFEIDRKTGQSTAEFGYLVKRGIAEMKKSFY